jgi:hypothetical protein
MTSKLKREKRSHGKSGCQCAAGKLLISAYHTGEVLARYSPGNATHYIAKNSVASLA